MPNQTTTRLTLVRDAPLAACPDWCRFLEIYPNLSHDYDSLLPGDRQTGVRTHISGEDDGSIAQEEYNRDGHVTFSILKIFTDCEDLTSAEARALASRLTASADLYDDIVGHTSLGEA